MTVLLTAVVCTYLLGIVSPLSVQRPSRQSLCAYGSAALGCLLGVILAALGSAAPSPLLLSLPSTLPYLTFAVRIDTLASVFLIMISGVGLAVSIYALSYARHAHSQFSAATLGGLYNGFLLAMTLVVLADNGFFFLMVWEAMSLLSYFLVIADHEKPETRYAGLFYLVMAHLGTAFIIVTFLIFFQGTGSFSFSAFRQLDQPLSEGLRTLVFMTALLGFGAKAGIVPLHVWLPYAHPAAPSHVSALMSGVMIKTAIYGLIRVYFDFLGGPFPWWWGAVILVIGGVSALLGVMYALMEHDLKSLLAFHSVENIGIILLGLGAGMIFFSYGFMELAALGLVAALYHTINHAVFKALLFLGAGSLLAATGTRNIEAYGGLLRRMPWTGACFLMGTVSIIALPPTNGFISEWLIFQSLFLSAQLPDLLLKLLLPISAAALALTAALALACFAKAFGLSFLALPRSRHSHTAQEAPFSMRIGMVSLAVLCLALGLAPMLVLSVLDRAAAPFVGVAIAKKILAFDGWAVAPANVSFSSVSPPVLALMLILAGGLALLLTVVIGGRLKRRYSRTWACGLRLSPRMEYTAAGFVQPIRQVFSLIYRPTVKLETELLEESHYVAKRRRFEFHIEPVFQTYLYEPIQRACAAAADRLRPLQAGSLHVYLTYIFVTIVALLLVGG